MEKSVKRPKSKGKLILNAVFGILAAIMIIFVAVLLIGKVKNKPAFLFGKACVWIMTNSMEDEIPARSYILVERVKASQVEENDVIIFTSDDPTLNGGMNTHRVIRVVGDHEEFATKGDHNENEDNYTAKADKVWGRYVKCLPIMTALMRFFLTPTGLATVLILLLAITVAMFVPDLVKAGKQSKEKQQIQKQELEKMLIEQEIQRLSEQQQKKEQDAE